MRWIARGEGQNKAWLYSSGSLGRPDCNYLSLEKRQKALQAHNNNNDTKYCNSFPSADQEKRLYAKVATRIWRLCEYIIIIILLSSPCGSKSGFPQNRNSPHLAHTNHYTLRITSQLRSLGAIAVLF